MTSVIKFKGKLIIPETGLAAAGVPPASLANQLLARAAALGTDDTGPVRPKTHTIHQLFTVESDEYFGDDARVYNARMLRAREELRRRGVKWVYDRTAPEFIVCPKCANVIEPRRCHKADSRSISNLRDKKLIKNLVQDQMRRRRSVVADMKSRDVAALAPPGDGEGRETVGMSDDDEDIKEEDVITDDSSGDEREQKMIPIGAHQLAMEALRVELDKEIEYLGEACAQRDQALEEWTEKEGEWRLKLAFAMDAEKRAIDERADALRRVETANARMHELEGKFVELNRSISKLTEEREVHMERLANWMDASRQKTAQSLLIDRWEVHCFEAKRHRLKSAQLDKVTKVVNDLTERLTDANERIASLSAHLDRLTSKDRGLATEVLRRAGVVPQDPPLEMARTCLAFWFERLHELRAEKRGDRLQGERDALEIERDALLTRNGELELENCQLGNRLYMSVADNSSWRVHDTTLIGRVLVEAEMRVQEVLRAKLDAVDFTFACTSRLWRERLARRSANWFFLESQFRRRIDELESFIDSENEAILQSGSHLGTHLPSRVRVVGKGPTCSACSRQIVYQSSRSTEEARVEVESPATPRDNDWLDFVRYGDREPHAASMSKMRNSHSSLAWRRLEKGGVIVREPVEGEGRMQFMWRCP